MGKGSRPRPYSVDRSTFESNWDRIFQSPRERDDALAENEAFDLVQQRMEQEKQSLRRMRDSRNEAEKQQAAWLKDEYYDLNQDENNGHGSTGN